MQIHGRSSCETAKIIAFIKNYEKNKKNEQIIIIIIATKTPYFAGGNATLIIL